MAGSAIRARLSKPNFMPWISIAPADLSLVLNSAEIATATRFTTENQVDVIAEAISQSVALVRGYVAQRSPLDQAGTIPDSLKGSALALAAVQVLTRVKLTVSEARNKASDDARSLLRSVGRGEFFVEAPANTVSTAIESALPSFENSHRHFTHHSQDGI